MKSYNDLAIRDLRDFVYGTSPNPVRLKNGMVIGGGTVYPELNFTLPPMEINESTMPAVRNEYRSMIDGACSRAVDLGVPGLVVEFELLPPMTMNPQWGADVTAVLREVMDRHSASSGLKSALRVTPNDIRENERPPQLHGVLWERMLRSFELCAKAGADMLAIESTGGKEVNDDAMIAADLPAVAFALGVLGPRDMKTLWQSISNISAANKVIPSGDTACGFGNTAMVLADRKYLPKVFAAVIRVMTVARSLVAFEYGAVGPNKDCGYEGPFLKAITGCPISMEGADAACAHLSPVGNIARAVPDLWSNESVQNVKLLGGMAPTVSLEQLAYSVRLMNTASSRGPDSALNLRDCLVDSDSALDPQAYVLRPDVVLDLSAEILKETSAYARTRRSAVVTLDRLRKACATKALFMSEKEMNWLDRLSEETDALPETEEELARQVIPTLDPAKVQIGEYGL